MAPPMPTMPFLSDELVAMHMSLMQLATSAALSLFGLMIAGIRGSYGLIAYSWMVSTVSVGISSCAWAIFCNGDVNLRNTLMLILESGFVLGSV